MNYNLLFILVEGPDDERFFNKIIRPRFEKKNVWVKFYNYSIVKEIKINKFLKSINAMGADYIFVADINHVPCITLKKDKIQNKIQDIDRNKIVVVIKEIEGWYIAGIDDENSPKLGFKNMIHTNDLTKEDFDRIAPKKFRSRIDFMQEILNVFQVDIAKRKNDSFKYFTEKFDV